MDSADKVIVAVLFAVLWIFMSINAIHVEKVEDALKSKQDVVQVSEAQVDCVLDQAITDVLEIAYVCEVPVDTVLELSGDVYDIDPRNHE